MNEPEGPDRDPVWVAGVQTALRSWFGQARRELPWRVDRNPYRVLLSEFMLVQTTVAAVVPFFERFLARFPTIGDLARAEEADVLAAWEGLGYYRRARQLHETARAVVRDHAGQVPSELEALLELPGVGRYIAGAVLSFAFDRPAPILEANSQRVLARLLAWREELTAKTTRDRLWTAAARLVPAHGAGLFNEALMELGATVCTVREPLCLLCPVGSFCRSKALGLQNEIPVVLAKAPPKQVTESCYLIERDGRVLILRRDQSSLWAGMWEFPTIHLEGADPARRAFSEEIDAVESVRRLTGATIEPGPAVKTVRFTVTTHRVILTAHSARYLEGDLRPGPRHDHAEWAAPDDLSRFTFGSAQRKLAQWWQANRPDRGAPERMEGA